MTEPCRLYLIATADADAADALADALSGGDVACILISAGPEGVIDRDAAAPLVGLAHERKVAVLIDRDVDAAAALGADGVHLDADRHAYETARGRLGADAIIGAACGASRDSAMTLGDMGADYVAFAAGPSQGDLMAWWAELFEVPCVAWDVADKRAAEALARRGADFVSIAPAVWAGTDETPASAVGEWTRALSAVKSAA